MQTWINTQRTTHLVSSPPARGGLQVASTRQRTRSPATQGSRRRTRARWSVYGAPPRDWCANNGTASRARNVHFGILYTGECHLSGRPSTTLPMLAPTQASHPQNACSDQHLREMHAHSDNCRDGSLDSERCIFCFGFSSCVLWNVF